MTGKPEGGPLRATRAGSRLLPHVYGSGRSRDPMLMTSGGEEASSSHVNADDAFGRRRDHAEQKREENSSPDVSHARHS